MNPNEERSGWLKTRSGIVLLCFLAIVGVLLLSEHRAHVLGVIPYLLFLACPLMHVFHHHGHSRPDDERSGQSTPIHDHSRRSVRGEGGGS